MLIVFSGEGQGKTSAALGILLRAWGRGRRVALVQFVKTETGTGETKALRHLGIECLVTGEGFVGMGGDRKGLGVHQEAAKRGLKEAEKLLLSGEYELLVFDEIFIAMSEKLLEKSEVLDLLKKRPKGVDLVLTGRGAVEEIVLMADTVTEMKKIKHEFDKGKVAREGVNF